MSKKQAAPMQPHSAKYIRERVINILQRKDAELLEADRKAAEAKREEIRDKKVKFFAGQSPALLAELLVRGPYGRGINPRANRLHEQANAFVRKDENELARLEGRGGRNYVDNGRVCLYHKVTIAKYHEVMDSIMLGDQKEALKAIAALERWKP